jgi:hypothetical protein
MNENQLSVNDPDNLLQNELEVEYTEDENEDKQTTRQNKIFKNTNIKQFKTNNKINVRPPIKRKMNMGKR